MTDEEGRPESEAGSQGPGFPALVAPPSEPERYPFWEYGDVLVFVGLAISSMFFAELLARGLMTLVHWRPSVKALEVLPTELLGYAFLFVGLWGIFRLKYGQPFWRSLAWNPMRLPPALVVACGTFTGLGVAIASSLIRTPETSNEMTELMAGRTALIVVAVFGVTMAPLFEELAFRGFLQPLLVRSLGAVPGILLTAIPFGLLHYQQYGRSWQHAAVISLAGAAFGAMRHVTGSTKAATAMHAAYNAFFFAALFARKD